MVTRVRGFTIVELLIVIVVIAILAAITIVAYNGIQSQAYNSTVMTDLRNNAQSINTYFVDKGSYPTTAVQLIAETNASASPRLNIKATKSAYNTNRINFIFCFGATNGEFALVAQSKGGKAYYITNANSTPRELTDFPTAQATVCPSVGASLSGQWGHNGGWEGWVQG